MSNDPRPPAFSELASQLHTYCLDPAVRAWVVGVLLARLSTPELVDLVDAAEILRRGTLPAHPESDNAGLELVQRSSWQDAADAVIPLTRRRRGL